MDIANRILELRKKAGLSQEELANRCSVSRQAVSKWESGQASPDIEKVIRICEVFEISADYLLMGENTEITGRDEIEITGIEPISGRKSIAGHILLGFSALSLLILAIVASVVGGEYTEYVNDEVALSAHGIPAFLLNNHLVWLPIVLAAAAAAGCILIFVNRRAKKECMNKYCMNKERIARGL